ncbi:MAG: siderophore-interacting protein [Naasia sp.]|jgi:NADPH-dependent ferric siderophore reductase|uniref:siderophore-interacting protein n=1 Tax=Naasia sp. TaxID=2546198 RepID=UPI002633A8CA|nr:siderophore-interacting protein [Naasia sp.]MCU1571326.1 siderophore-interacting protein [Naasia sp.]
MSIAPVNPADFARERIRHELLARELRVLRRERLTSTIARITLAGDALAGFAAPGPEDHVKLIFPAPPGERIARDFTPARVREGELDLDFVLHGDAGPASRFAATAQPGDPLVVAGPRGSRLAPAGVRKAVLLADESSLAALARWIEALRWRAEILAFVQSDSPDVLDYPLPTGDRVAITRIGTGPEHALAAVASPGIDSHTYVWAAGEASALVPARRHLRREAGLDKHRAKVDGYWRIGVAGLDHHAPLDPDDPED